jgi:hypothetical protein
VPSLKSKLDTIGGNVAAEAVRKVPVAGKKGGGAWMALAGVLVIGGAGVFVVKGMNRKQETGNRKPEMAEKSVAAAPAPKVEAPKVEVKATVPDEVRVQVKVRPEGAQLFLDDAPIANPFDGRFARSDARHKLEARAPGHKSEAQWIAFDHDHNVDVALGAIPVRQSVASPVKKAEPSDGKPVYKGTKGKLITDFPTE